MKPVLHHICSCMEHNFQCWRCCGVFLDCSLCSQISPLQPYPNTTKSRKMAFLRRSRQRNQAKGSATTEKPTGGRKSRSLLIDDSKPMSGVFVSSRTLQTASPPTSFSSMESSYSSETQDLSPASWKTSGAKNHQRGAPLFVPDPDKENQEILDPAEKLGMVMARARQLPDTWYFSSNHVLVNQERSKRTVAPLVRMRGLDEIARLHAEQMANEANVHHLDLDALRLALKDVNHRRLGANVQKGESIRGIHEVMMQTLSNKNNIVDRRFTHMGMGTATDENGTLYLCQVFRG